MSILSAFSEGNFISFLQVTCIVNCLSAAISLASNILVYGGEDTAYTTLLLQNLRMDVFFSGASLKISLFKKNQFVLITRASLLLPAHIYMTFNAVSTLFETVKKWHWKH